jgi:hypothetical protein
MVKKKYVIAGDRGGWSRRNLTPLMNQICIVYHLYLGGSCGVEIRFLALVGGSDL